MGGGATGPTERAPRAGTGRRPCFVRCGLDPAYDLEIGGDRVHDSTSGEEVTILDFETKTYRPTRLVDLYDAARLSDTGNGRW